MKFTLWAKRSLKGYGVFGGLVTGDIYRGGGGEGVGAHINGIKLFRNDKTYLRNDIKLTYTVI